MNLWPIRGLNSKYMGYKVYVFQKDSIKAFTHHQLLNPSLHVKRNTSSAVESQ